MKKRGPKFDVYECVMVKMGGWSDGLYLRVSNGLASWSKTRAGATKWSPTQRVAARQQALDHGGRIVRWRRWFKRAP